MTLPGLGQYDIEYAQNACVWGTSPGKYVTLLSGRLHAARVLDLGAGEGKNAIFLAGKGHQVVAVECSAYACANFRRRVATLGDAIARRIIIVEGDVRTVSLPTHVDAVISYGLLHCLPSEGDAQRVVERMKDATAPQGYNVVVTFTDDLPVPREQAYLNPTFLTLETLRSWYSPWRIIAAEIGEIKETHPSNLSPHRHSVCRLLAQRD